MPDDFEVLRAEQAIQAFEATALDFGTRFVKDSGVRSNYLRASKSAAAQARAFYSSGVMTPQQAAEWANQERNAIMELSRFRSSDLGRAYAESLKESGLTLESLCTKYAEKLFNASFEKLSPAQKNSVYLKIVERAACPNAKETLKAARLGKLGKGLWFLTAAIVVYNITTAEDPARQSVKEGVTLGGGWVGGALGGGAAGLACGPGAPVCVAIGIFVGGVLGALGADFAFENRGSIWHVWSSAWESFERLDAVHRSVTGRGLMSGPPTRPSVWR